MSEAILGIHHVTAICSDAQTNYDFYSKFLGLRLVKLTVNFDDPGTYHLYYGDGLGHPGTILTFFPYPSGRKGETGTGMISSVALAVGRDSFQFWMDRLTAAGIHFDGPNTRFGERSIGFADPDGLRLELVETGFAGARPWTGVPVPAEHMIQGIQSVTLAVEGYERTAKLLQEVMGFRPEGHEQNRYRYHRNQAVVGAYVEVSCQPYQPRGHGGAGTVHHVAFRVESDHIQRVSRIHLVDQGFNVSPVMDRQYFHSIYFREPGGVLFEIATDPPGFMKDESEAELGTTLKLPEWMEPQRDGIEKLLVALKR